MIVAAEGGANSRAQRRPPPGAIFRYDCVFPQKGQGMGRVSSMLQGVERVVVGWAEFGEAGSGEVEIRIRGPMPVCPQLCWNVKCLIVIAIY